MYRTALLFLLYLFDTALHVCVCPSRWARCGLLPNWTGQWLRCCLHQDHSCSVPLRTVLHPQWKQNLDQVWTQSYKYTMRKFLLSPQGGSILAFTCLKLMSSFLLTAMEVWLRSSQCSPRHPWRIPRLGRWRTRSRPSSWKGVLEEWHSEHNPSLHYWLFITKRALLVCFWATTFFFFLHYWQSVAFSLWYDLSFHFFYFFTISPIFIISAVLQRRRWESKRPTQLRFISTMFACQPTVCWERWAEVSK